MNAILSRYKKRIPQRWKKRAKALLHTCRQIDIRERYEPSFIILGAQKAGTSSLYNYLAQHPQLVPSYRKEIHYFDNGIDPGSNNYAKGRKWYSAHFPVVNHKGSEPRMAFEASPMYMFHPEAARKISEFDPQMKLIFMLRNPTSRAISHYNHEVKNGRERLALQEALMKEDKRISPAIESKNYNDPVLKNFSYKARGRYLEQLQNYLQYFGTENIHVMISENFFRDPEAELAQLFTFLGVRQHDKIDFRAVNVATSKSSSPEAKEYLDSYFAGINEELFSFLGLPAIWK